MIFSDEFRRCFQRQTAYAEPTYALEDCVAAMEANGWIFMEDDADADARETKFREVGELFRATLPLCDEREMAFLSLAADLSEKRAALDTDISDMPFWLFFRGDSVYLFCTNGDYFLVLPDELRKIFREVTEAAGFAAENARKRELSEYAAALANLYGVYDVDQFLLVWNRHHREKITEEEAISFLEDREQFYSDFYFMEDFIVHMGIDEEEAEDLLEATEELEYYMPPKSVIREYARRGNEFPSDTGLEEIIALLTPHLPPKFDEEDKDYLKFLLIESCERQKSPERVRHILEKHDAPLSNPAFRETFERLYRRLRNNTNA
ncbi:MAG: hypothetical protein FWF10_11265 [Clostridiales bacterium]|nr:hypothetical protein [Clostridiales bacterium]